MDKVARPAQKATHQLTKQHNRDLVLKTLLDSEAVSRAGIARLTGLTRTTVSEIISSLIVMGLVEELGPGSSSGGKPSILLRLVADSRYIIGVNLAQHRFVASLVNLRGEIKQTVEVKVQGADGNKAIRLAYQLLDTFTSKTWPLVGIGVGTPGLINTGEGIVVNAVNLDWQDLPLASLLERRYALPVRLLNDSQATAIGEFVYGAHPRDSNLIVVNVGYGIGAGILIHGQLFQGDGGGAGEIGHVQVDDNGMTCRCGRRGCLETRASGWAILQAVQQLPGMSQGTVLRHIESLFTKGDPAVRRIVLDSARSLGKAIGSLVGTLDIRKIVFTGEVTRFGDDWLEAVRQGLSTAALESMVRETRLEIGRLDTRASILGASAYLLLDDYSLLFARKEN